MLSKQILITVFCLSLFSSCTVEKKEYYTDGNIKSSYFIDAFTKKKEGKYIFYSIEGDTIEKSNFSNNKLDGITYLYNENNVLQKTIEYKKDQMWGMVKEYYTNGKLRCELEYYKDRLWNIYTVYDSVGNKLKFGEIHNGFGKVKVFDANGNITEEGEFSNGYRLGIWQEYTNTGHSIETKYDTSEQKVNYY